MFVLAGLAACGEVDQAQDQISVDQQQVPYQKKKINHYNKRKYIKATRYMAMELEHLNNATQVKPCGRSIDKGSSGNYTRNWLPISNPT